MWWITDKSIYCSWYLRRTDFLAQSYACGTNKSWGDVKRAICTSLSCNVVYCPGGRTADAIVQEALSVARTVANDRLGGKKAGSGGKKSGGGTPGDAVVELTDSNFEEMVINSEDYWLVEFYAPWYVHQGWMRDESTCVIRSVWACGSGVCAYVRIDVCACVKSDGVCCFVR